METGAPEDAARNKKKKRDEVEVSDLESIKKEYFSLQQQYCFLQQKQSELNEKNYSQALLFQKLYFILKSYVDPVKQRQLPKSFLEDFDKFVEVEIFSDVHKLGKSKISTGNHALFEAMQSQCLQLREENSKLYKKIEDLQIDQSSIMTELDTCQTQHYNTVKKLQSDSEILHRSLDNKTKSFNREIKKLNDLVEELESEGRKYRKESDERERVLITKLSESKQELHQEKEDGKAKATSIHTLEQKLKEKQTIIQNLETNIARLKAHADNELRITLESLNKEKHTNKQLESQRQELMNKIETLELNLIDDKKSNKRQADNYISEIDKLNDIIKEHNRTTDMLRAEITSKESIFGDAKKKWEHEKNVLEHELFNVKSHLHKLLNSNQKQIIEEELQLTRTSLQHHIDAFQLERSNLYKQNQDLTEDLSFAIKINTELQAHLASIKAEHNNQSFFLNQIIEQYNKLEEQLRGLHNSFHEGVVDNRDKLNPSIFDSNTVIFSPLSIPTAPPFSPSNADISNNSAGNVTNKTIPSHNPMYNREHSDLPKQDQSYSSIQRRFTTENSPIKAFQDSGLRIQDASLDISDLDRLNSTNLHSSFKLGTTANNHGQSLQSHLDILNSLDVKFSPFKSLEMETYRSKNQSSDLLDSLEVIERQLATVKSYNPVSLLENPRSRRTKSPRTGPYRRSSIDSPPHEYTRLEKEFRSLEGILHELKEDAEVKELSEKYDSLAKINNKQKSSSSKSIKKERKRSVDKPIRGTEMEHLTTRDTQERTPRSRISHKTRTAVTTKPRESSSRDISTGRKAELRRQLEMFRSKAQKEAQSRNLESSEDAQEEEDDDEEQSEEKEEDEPEWKSNERSDRPQEVVSDNITESHHDPLKVLEEHYLKKRSRPPSASKSAPVTAHNSPKPPRSKNASPPSPLSDTGGLF